MTALSTLAALERASIAKLVAALAEFDRRKLFLPLGFTSLFAYCTNRLGLSQDETFRRIEAARVSRRFPLVLDYLEKGAINLTTARLLGPHLTNENQKNLLDAASHQKRPEVDVLIARLRPKPDVPSTIRKLPDLAPRGPDVMVAAGAVGGTGGAAEGEAAGAAGGLADGAAGGVADGAAGGVADGAAGGVADGAAGGVADGAATGLPGSATGGAAGGGPDGSPGRVSNVDASAPLLAYVAYQARQAQIPARRPIVAPLSESSYRLQVTISKATHDTLREIQALIRHVIPNGDPAAIVARSLDLLLADLRKKKLGQVGRPRPARGTPPRGRHIPPHVKRRVWERDGGRCAFVSKAGVRCDEDGFVEYHHVKPYARGGKTTVDNIQLRCRAHNAHEAELVFGRAGPR